MSLIHVSNLTFAYDGSYHNVFENVSLQIDTNWKLGLIGRNGRGKTTFLQLLLGRYGYQGNITATVSFEYFPFEIANQSLNTLTIIRTIYPEIVEWELNKELSILGVSNEVLERPFETLSHGERTKVLLATLFLKPNLFLLIDEPTDNLDLIARKTVSDYLNEKKGFILVSHDEAFLDHCIDHVLSINKSNIEVQRGNFSSWWQNKEMQDQLEIAQNERLRTDIKRLSASARRTAQWSDKVEKSKNGSGGDKGYISHKAAKMMKRSKSLEGRKERAIDEKKQLLKNIDDSIELIMKPLQYKKDKLIEVSDLTVSYSDKVVCQGVNFTLRQGDRIALLGRNGSGKSCILKLLLGEEIQYGGKLNVGTGLKISFLPQDTSFLKGDLRKYIQSHELSESVFKAALHQLGFTKEQFDKDMSGLSSGQKKKVLIAQSLCEEAHLYIWDEPLNYVDVISRKQIESVILRVHPTMLFVEHDQAFTDNVSTNKIQL